MTRIVPLDELDGRIPRIGKISAGYTDARTANGKIVIFPVKSRTLVFRGSEREPLDAAAAIVGGDVSASPNLRAEGLWRLISKATAIDIAIADELRDRPGRYEFWAKHGKLRDCDGRSCRFLIDPQSGERREEVPCFCIAHGLTTKDPDACRITTRLNVIVPAFAEIPGMGVWQLESRSRTTFSDLKGLFHLCRALGLPGVSGLPVTLRIEIISSRSAQTGQAREFPVFRFFPRASFSDVLNKLRGFQAAVSPAQLPPPDESTPPLGAVLDVAQEAVSNGAAIVDAHCEPANPNSTAVKSPGPSSAVAPEAALPRRMPLPEFRELARKAAVILGAKGSTPGKTWLLQHYGTSNPAGLSDEQYEDAIRRLREIINSSGNAGWNSSSTSASEPQPPARHPLAGPELIGELHGAFEHLGYAPDERPARIRAFTGGRTGQPEEMTEYEIRALLDELRPGRVAQA